MSEKNKGMIKSAEDIQMIAAGGTLIHDILRRTGELVKPGISTAELDRYVEAEILKIGGIPAFKNYGPKKNPFPATLCTSLNSEVVHGIPSDQVILQEGDIISLDIGMQYLSRYTDTAITVGVGTISGEAQALIDTTERALSHAIAQAVIGNRIGDIAYATQSTVEKNGFNVVREMVGHGVGFDVHEPPDVPCYGKAHTGLLLQEGMVLAIEPMVVAGKFKLQSEADGWTISTVDGSLAAHFEHTIAITKKGPRILT